MLRMKSSCTLLVVVLAATGVSTAAPDGGGAATYATHSQSAEIVTSRSLPPFDSPPLSPAESAKLIHVRSGYEAELVAAEPLLESPVAIDWDEHGRLWVVEMVDYPLGLDGKGKPGG